MVSSSAEKERQNAFLVSVIIFFNCCDCSYQCSRVACIYTRGLAGVEKTLSIISACASSQGACEVIKHGQLSGTGHRALGAGTCFFRQSGSVTIKYPPPSLCNPMPLRSHQDITSIYEQEEEKWR